MFKECEALKKTTYKTNPKLEEAPGYTDCLTAVARVVSNTLGINLPLRRIGNMPGDLVNKWKWEVKVISKKEMLPGDLLFLQGNNCERLISHIAIVANEIGVFHCSQEKKGGVIENLDEVFLRYKPMDDPDAMLNYVDPRPERVFELSAP